MGPRSNDRGNSRHLNQSIFNDLSGQMRAATSQTPISGSFIYLSCVQPTVNIACSTDASAPGIFRAASSLATFNALQKRGTCPTRPGAFWRADGPGFRVIADN